MTDLFGETKAAPARPAPGENGFRYRRQYGLIVVCESEADQQGAYDALRRQGYAVKVVAV